MSEYINVEKPFLDKLDKLGWKVFDLGAGIPKNPKTSFRNDFKEVVLEDIFKTAVKKINRTDTGIEWLTDQQLTDIYEDLTDYGHTNLHEANKRIHEILLRIGTDNKISVAKNEVTGEEYPLLKLIDFDNWEDNDFRAINQFRVDTIGTVKSGGRPDVVLFVNGLPLIVVECKDEDVAQPLSEAYDQIRMYQDSRDENDDFADLKEGCEELFYYNVFSIITHGKEARVGSISAEFDYYYNWKDIFPTEYKVIEPGDKEQSKRQEVLIHGILNKEILLDVLRHFTLFMEIKKGVEIKVIPRYQQYRAASKLLDRLKRGNNGKERSGVVWHTQGSGKSLTMVFTIRKLRSDALLKKYKVILINDRTALEDQLSKTALLTGETPHLVANRSELQQLKSQSSDLNMVMIHKFLQEEIKHAKALQKAISQSDEVPEFKPFPIINTSEHLLIMIDEAHRTQKGSTTGDSMSDNLFTAFPNATKIAFTGTPLLTKRHKIRTQDRFGDFIDTYKIKESEEDRATLPIRYIGRTGKDEIKDKEGFQAEFEDMFKEQSQEVKAAIIKRYGGVREYLESTDRIRKRAKDLVDHYVDNILENGFKAQVVASSVLAACRYKFLIEKEIKRRLAAEQAKNEPDTELIKQIAFLKVAAVVSSQGNTEDKIVRAARNHAKEVDAVNSFKLDFEENKPNSGVAFLCVCDRLLTGFDAPVEQVMYIDKKMQEHDLLQAIARVNRTKKGKKYGLVVDYIGLAENLKEALGIYGGGDAEDNKALEEFLTYFRDIDKEIPVLEARYHRLVHLFKDNLILDIEDFLYQRMTDKQREIELVEEVITLAKKPAFRAQFDTYLKSFFDSLDILFNTDTAKGYWLPAKRLGYLLMKIRNRYRDKTLDLKWASAKVRKLLDKYLISEGVDPKIPPVDLLSDEFPKVVNKLKLAKAKASEMEHAIRRHIKVDFDNDPTKNQRLLDKMEKILTRFKDNFDRQAEELAKFREEEIKAGRTKEQEEGLEQYELPFYEMVLVTAFGAADGIAEAKKKIAKEVINEAVEALQKDIDVPKFWKKDSLVQRLRGELEDIFLLCDAEEISDKNEQITTEILHLAEKRHKDLIDGKS